MYATRATIHTSLKATPIQIVFGREDVLNTKFKAEWKYIRDHQKGKLIEQNNTRENAKRTRHDYVVGDCVLIAAKLDGKYQGDIWDSMYVATVSAVPPTRSPCNCIHPSLMDKAGYCVLYESALTPGCSVLVPPGSHDS
jgi:hypothetical protein